MRINVGLIFFGGIRLRRRDEFHFRGFLAENLVQARLDDGIWFYRVCLAGGGNFLFPVGGRQLLGGALERRTV